MAAKGKEQTKKKVRKVSPLPAMPPAINFNVQIESKILTGEEHSKTARGNYQPDLLFLVHEVRINGSNPMKVSEPIAFVDEGIKADTEEFISKAHAHLEQHIEEVIGHTVKDLITESVIAAGDKESRQANLAGVGEIAYQIFGSARTLADCKSVMHQQIGYAAAAMLSRVNGHHKGYVSDKTAKKIRLNSWQLRYIASRDFSVFYQQCAKARKIYEGTGDIPKQNMPDEVIAEAIKEPHPKSIYKPYCYDLPTIACIYAARQAGVMEATMEHVSSIRGQLETAGIKTKKPARKKSNE